MTEKYQKIIAAFKEINFQPKVNDFQDRLVIQKIVYLLQLKGLDTQFNYGLHIRGPYSRTLANELFTHKEEFEKLKTDVKLDSNEVKAAHELRNLFGLTPSLLEVGATYAYFSHEQKLDPITATKRTKEVKKSVSETKIAVGISKAKEFLFQPTVRELDALRNEMAPWQNASTTD